MHKNEQRQSARQLRSHGRVAVFCTALMWAVSPIMAQQNPPPTIPNGVITLPQDAPPTGLQAPLPAPALPLTRPDKPLRVSPGIAALSLELRNRPITINDAVAIALSANRSLALTSEALLRAQGRADEARAAFNPTLSGSLSYTRLNQSQSVTIGGNNINIVNDSQRQIGAQATLPIDISGLLRAATDQAKFNEVTLRLDVNRARNQIVSDVKSAFYDVLRAQALVTVATENLQNSVDRLTDAEKKLQAGTVARFDVIRAQTDVANAQQQLITSRTNVSLSIAALNNAIGIDIDTPLQVTDTQAVETPPGTASPDANAPAPSGTTEKQNGAGNNPVAQTNPTPGNTIGQERSPITIAFDPLNLGPQYEAALKEALETRPEVWQADAGIAAARKGIILAQRSQLPSAGLSWGLTYAPDTAGFSPVVTQWSAVASVSLPLFDGGVARARVRQARADVATAETNRRQAVDQITLDVRQSYLTLVQARNRVAVANQGLVQAREGFRLARVRYNAGVSAQAGISPLLEVSDAQVALTQAENSQVNALYDYNNARARLDRAIGRYSFVNNGPGYSRPPSPKAVGRSDRGENK